jgi:predicted metalloprotease
MSRFLGLIQSMLLPLLIALAGCAPVTITQPTVTPRPQISTPTPPIAEADHFTEIINGTLEDLDAFWSAEFRRSQPSKPYSSPQRYLPYNRHSSGSICGRPLSKLLDNAVYCPADKSIAWDEDFLRTVNGEFSRVNDMGPVVILAHEWGHHVQNLTERANLEVQRELQADCYAGMYVAYASEGQGLIALEPGDVMEAAMAFFTIGDKVYTKSNWFESGAHGSPAERVMAFARGYLSSDFAFCMTYAEYEFRDDLKIGTYSLNLIPSIRHYRSDESGLVELHGAGCTIQVMARPDLTSSAASQQFEAVKATWFGQTEVSVSSLTDGSFAVFNKGTAVGQKYQQFVPSAQQTFHGLIFLHVKPGGGGLVMDVFADGAAPAGPGDWRSLESCLFLTLYGLRF